MEFESRFLLPNNTGDTIDKNDGIVLQATTLLSNEGRSPFCYHDF